MHAEAFEAELREGEVSMGVGIHLHQQCTFFPAQILDRVITPVLRCTLRRTCYGNILCPLQTTIMAVTFDGGVVLGADSRTSTGSYIANRVTDKLTQLTDNVSLNLSSAYD